MKKLFNVLLTILLAFTLFSCKNNDVENNDTVDAKANGEATILYTNDVHGYINNQVKDSDGNYSDGISYANVKALKDELISEGKNVLLVDAGDHSQGTAYSSVNDGEEMIKIMNATGYDLATLGNHEFDYGQYQAFKLMDLADFDYVSCNFTSLEDNSLVLKPYKVLEAGDLKIAFVGISTPETITSSTPSYFMDADGNYIYGFCGGNNGQDLYDAVQSAIDEAKKEADVIIALGHLGVDDSASPWTSKEVIANTSGLDAFIDAHSHTKIEGDTIKDKDGNDVILTQTKSYLSYIGQMDVKVTDGKISITTSLIDDYTSRDETVQSLVDDVVNTVNEELDKEIATSSVPFYITDPDSGERICRKVETNSGDVVADAFYWYFNEYKQMDCDVAVYNGPGLKADLPNGLLTLKDCKALLPFGNVICMIEVTGQELLDGLDYAVKSLPDETSILIGAGIKYSVDTSVEPTAVSDDSGMWQSGPTSGEYRVKDVEIYNRETNEYEPLDLTKTYRLAGANHSLRNGGGGLTMFANAKLVLDYVDEDYMILGEYIKAFTNNEVSSSNSPLAKYSNYLINYESAYGSSRITIE